MAGLPRAAGRVHAALAAALLAAQAAWLAVATAYAGDMYRYWRNMASDYVMMMVLVAASFALYRVARRDAAEATPEATPD